jgi:hypothetical protein
MRQGYEAFFGLPPVISRMRWHSLLFPARYPRLDLLFYFNPFNLH